MSASVRISLTIDQLVMSGLSPSAARRAEQAFRIELTRRMGEMSPDALEVLSAAAVDLPVLRLTPPSATGPAALGRAAARGIFQHLKQATSSGPRQQDRVLSTLDARPAGGGRER